MKKLSIFIVFALMATMLGANTSWTILSPSSKHSMTITKSSSTEPVTFVFELQTEGQYPIGKSAIGLNWNGDSSASGYEVIQVEENSVSNLLDVVVPNYASTINEEYNEKRIFFSNGLVLNMRAYNDGCAYRWESTLDKEILVYNEEMELNFTENYVSYFPKPNGIKFFSHHENGYKKKRLASVGKMELACVPLLVELNNDKILMISDINLQNYPGLWVKRKSFGKPALVSTFPPYPKQERLIGDRNYVVAKDEDFIAKLPAAPEGSLSWTSWKAFLMGEKKNLFNPSLFYCLAEETTMQDTSWIKPGLTVWDWWTNLNFTDTDFKGGVNQESYIYNIDFAAKHGVPFVVLDEGWSVPGPKNLLKVVPEIDLPALSEYAKSKGVSLILWMTSIALEMNYDTAFDQFKEWGIAGLKIDFLQRDDQRMMDFCYKTAEKAAEYKLLVNYHGGSKPAGITRTWPNVLTIESVLGLEQNKWGLAANPDMAVKNAFLRMPAGPMDYTPGGMKNRQKLKFPINYSYPFTQGTRCHQLAMYVLYLSPLQMISDIVCNYNKNEESIDFIKGVPVTWDETKFLGGDPDSWVGVARRKGNHWYLGGLSNWSARTVSFNMDFLADGTYEMELYKDGPNANKNAEDYTIEKKTITVVNGTANMDIQFARGGGFAAKILPLN